MDEQNYDPQPPKRLFGDFRNETRLRQILIIVISALGVWLFPPLLAIFLIMAVYYRVKYPKR